MKYDARIQLVSSKQNCEPIDSFTAMNYEQRRFRAGYVPHDAFPEELSPEVESNLDAIDRRENRQSLLNYLDGKF